VCDVENEDENSVGLEAVDDAELAHPQRATPSETAMKGLARVRLLREPIEGTI
jgi:hypothetical protein